MNNNTASNILPAQSPLTRYAPLFTKGVQSTILAGFLSLAFLTPATAADFSGGLKGVSITDAQATNKAPKASFTYTVHGNTVTFDASGSTDPDGTIANYNWDFGDGSRGTGPKIEHTYDKTNNISATITIADNNSGVSLYQKQINFLACSSTPSYSEALTWADTGWWSASNQVGGIFTGSTSYNICSIDFYISKIAGNLTGKAIYARVYSLSGNNLETKLGEKQLVGADLTTGWNHVVFDSSIATGPSGFAVLITPVGDGINYPVFASGNNLGDGHLSRWSTSGVFEIKADVSFSLKIYE